MLRVILAVVAGFIAWSILWVGSDQLMTSLSPSWYGINQLAFEKAVFNKTYFVADNSICLFNLARSVVISILCGFLASVIANGNRNAYVALGIVLLVVGILVQAMVWCYLPLWYNLAFLILLIPSTILGGKLKKSS